VRKVLIAITSALIAAAVQGSFLKVCAVEIGFYPRLPSASDVEKDPVGSARILEFYREANLRDRKYKFIINPADRQKLQSTLAMADLFIFLQTADKMDLGLREVRPSEDHSQVQFPITLTRSAVTKFLKKEIRRDLLVVQFSKSMVHPDRAERELADLQSFFESIGYRRIIVLGSASSGVFVLSEQKFSRDDSGENLGSKRVADRVVRIERDLNAIDIGVPGRTFSPVELETFFLRDQHKDLLIVELGKSLCASKDRVQAIFESFGYRKVLVEFDSTSNKKSEE